MDFGTIISPFSLDSFYKDYFGKAVCHGSRKSPSHYENLIDHRYLRSFLLNGGFRASECRMIKAGSALSPYLYTTGDQKKSDFHTADLDRFVDPAKILGLYAEGYTISLMGMERYHPSLALLKNTLMNEFKAHISVNLYASPAGSSGLPAHEDPHDVLVLQISGKKRWEIFDRGQAEEFVLEQGDFAYIPAGSRHRATALYEPSMHLTFGIKCTSHLDLFQRFLTELSQLESNLKKPLRDSENALQILSDFIRSPKAEQAMKSSLEFHDRKWIDAASPVNHLGLESMDHWARGLDSNTRLRISNPHFSRIVPGNDARDLIYPGQKIEIHPNLVDFIASILKFDAQIFYLKKIMEFPLSEEQMQMLGFLVKDGFLEIVGAE